MTAITPELRRAIEESGGEPPHLIDPENNVDYVLIRADVCENVRALLEPDDGLDPRTMQARIWETMKGDWDDPRMDDYDNDPENPS